MANMDLKGATLKISSGGNSPKVALLKFGTGNLTWTEARGINYELERGKIAGATIRLADQAPVDVSFTGRWDTVVYSDFDPDGNTYENAADQTYKVEDILFGCTPSASGVPTLTSTDDDPCKPYACELVFEFDPTTIYGAACASSNQGVKYTFNPFRVESVQFDTNAGTIQCSGKVAAARITRDALT